MNEKIDYSKLADFEIDGRIATKIMEWFVDKGRIDKIPYYISIQEGNIMPVMPVEDWHPHNDISQVWLAQEKVINNFDRTKDRPGTIADWYAVFLRENLITIATHSGILYENDIERAIIHASPRQRCEAMLMAMEE